MTKIATIEGKGSGTLLRRAILLLAVATITVAMVVSTAAPAFAAPQGEKQPLFACTNGTTTILDVSPSLKQQFLQAGFTCQKSQRR
jgi:alpha-ketoglutarate-dependent taurine dioxygenase